MSASVLYTYGYEGLDVESFIARLKSLNIRMIVDVRELPLSRKKGFSKNALCQRLTETDIAYLHMPSLGCPKGVRDRYRLDQDWACYTRDFMAHLHSQDASVRELAHLALSTTACLICFEEDFTTCHRTYVARATGAIGGLSIKHVTPKKVVAEGLPQMVT